MSPGLVQLGTNNCTVIVGLNAQLLKYFAVFHLLSVWYDGQNILAQLVSYLGREILVRHHLPKGQRLLHPFHFFSRDFNESASGLGPDLAVRQSDLSVCL